LSIALLGSAFIYLDWAGLSHPLPETISALLFFWCVLQADRRVWFWVGFFLSLFWFWWIMVSFKHYHILWAVPIGLLTISLIYAFLFWAIAAISEYAANTLVTQFTPRPKGTSPYGQARASLPKAIGLLLLSHLHPLGFDWLKPALLFVHSYIGVQTWQLALVLTAILLSQYKKNSLFLLLVLLTYSPAKTTISFQDTDSPIALAHTMTSVEDKWNPALTASHITEVFAIIDRAITDRRQVIILPESVFPFFLNKEPEILDALLKRSEQIDIIIGALYLDTKQIHRNASYLLKKGRYTIANKVLLVPFGERNPLPEWAGEWVNRVFFDGAVDYIASAEPTNFDINGTPYRNAICYEACSEVLYRDRPKQMIVLSNNGWFIPSVEPTLQRLLLEFYSRKYGTTIYHSVNMSPSYTIKSTKGHL